MNRSVSVEVRANKIAAREEGAVLDSDEIVARPLTMPGVNGIKLKNPNIAIRWVECMARGGRNVELRKLAGFVVATPNDVEVPGIAFKDGVFRNGDVILMKIDRLAYLGSQKASIVAAQQRVSRKGITQKGAALLKETLANPTDAEGNSLAPAPSELRNKIQAFTPPVSEFPGLSEAEQEALSD